jgi:hypothetical protein
MPLKFGEKHHREVGAVDANPKYGPHMPMFSWKRMVVGKRETVDKGPPTTTKAEAASIPVSNGIHKTPTPPISYLNLIEPCTLCDIAPVVRSKNSGPYEITLDVLFSEKSIYNLMQTSNLLTPATIASLYNLSEDEIIYCGLYDQAMAFKATIPRKRLGKSTSGGPYMEADVHGSQQYVGLLQMELNEEVKRVIVGWNKLE